MNELLDGARILICLIFLTYASWSDFKKREVSNKVWVIFAPIAFTLTSLQFFIFAPQLLHIYALSFIVMLALSVVLFYAGAFGGADAKALICLSLALPSYPSYLLHPLFGSISPIFPLCVFSNAVVLAALSVFYVVARNCLWKHRNRKGLFEGFEKESRWRKFLVLLCGYKVNVAKLQKVEHLYPLEDFCSDGRKLLAMPKDEKRKEIVERIRRVADEGKLQDDVWVTPGLPLLVFITAGFLVALIFGDIVWILIRFTLGMP